MDVTIPCPCPGTPHESDTVTLFDKLDFHRATSITNMTAFIDNDDDKSRAAEVLAALSEGYLLHGIERWTLRDGKPVPVTKAAIRHYILDRPDIYPAVVEAADSVYHEVVLLPLVARASRSSPTSPTTASTSAKRGAASRRPKSSPSKPSSITTIPTGDTETTSSSLVIDSSTSQKSESAA